MADCSVAFWAYVYIIVTASIILFAVLKHNLLENWRGDL